MFPNLVLLAPFLAQADQIMILEDFVRRWGGRLTDFIENKKDIGEITKTGLKDWSNAVVAIARDPAASHNLELATFEDGKREIRVGFRFTTDQAKNARTSIENRRIALEKTSNSDFKRVLMVFSRSDVNSATLGKRTGELVIVEDISPKPLPLFYGSDLAEKQIKHEIREANDNIFKKGFSVDVNVKMKNEKPIAYFVTNVNQVIELPD